MRAKDISLTKLRSTEFTCREIKTSGIVNSVNLLSRLHKENNGGSLNVGKVEFDIGP